MKTIKLCRKEMQAEYSFLSIYFQKRKDRLKNFTKGATIIKQMPDRISSKKEFVHWLLQAEELH
jgi:hypothetical protein